MKIQDRFLDYVKYDTTSDPKSDSIPSTAKQKLLGTHLVEELKSIGITNAFIDEFGYVYGSLNGNTPACTIGFVAHMDTSNAVSGANIKPRIIENYDGKDIVLSNDVKTELARFSNLSDYVGKTLIVTDGTTLLGADDKAGIAVIIEGLDYFIQHPEIKHGKICVAFTPDEEIGKGTIKFNVEHFDCDFAYTVDGGKPYEVEYENFNAASALVKIKGLSTHPGGAKNMMINAINVAFEYHELLPTVMRPEYTEGYEGFNHLMEIKGDVEQAILSYIIRNHDEEKFNKQKELFEKSAAFINHRYKQELVELTILDSYRNMKQAFADKMYIIELAKQAIKTVGLEPECLAIRGGTDGAELTYKGIPCPNIGAGGQNFHSRYEFCCVEDMLKSVEVVKVIVEKAVNLKINHHE